MRSRGSNLCNFFNIFFICKPLSVISLPVLSPFAVSSDSVSHPFFLIYQYITCSFPLFPWCYFHDYLSFFVFVLLLVISSSILIFSYYYICTYHLIHSPFILFISKLHIHRFHPSVPIDQAHCIPNTPGSTHLYSVLASLCLTNTYLLTLMPLFVFIMFP